MRRERSFELLLANPTRRVSMIEAPVHSPLTRLRIRNRHRTTCQRGALRRTRGRGSQAAAHSLSKIACRRASDPHKPGTACRPPGGGADYSVRKATTPHVGTHGWRASPPLEWPFQDLTTDFQFGIPGG